MEKRYIGIDLGTTNSVVSYIEDGQPVVLPIDGAELVPSQVYYDEAATFVGIRAREHVSRERYGNHFASFKVNMGTSVAMTCPNRNMKIRPVMLSTEVLNYLYSKIKEKFPTEELEIVVTIPAYFTEPQRKATLKAMSNAGITTNKIINEPTAAAMLLLMDASTGKIPPMDGKKFIVFDFGGGTFDVSIIEISDSTMLQVIGTSGDANLGGDDIDDKIATWFARKAKVPKARFGPELKQAACDAKVALSEKGLTDKTAAVTMTVQHPDSAELGEVLTEVLTLTQFTTILQPIIAKMLKITTTEMAKLSLSTSDIDSILFVGGSTKIEQIKKVVSETLNMKYKDVLDPDISVSAGAAVTAYMAADNVDLFCIDATPFDLSVGLENGTCDQIIRKNSALPTQNSASYKNTTPTGARIPIYQGESQLASENKKIADLDLTFDEEIPPGEAVIDVVFNIDMKGILTVSATEVLSGMTVEAKITQEQDIHD